MIEKQKTSEPIPQPAAGEPGGDALEAAQGELNALLAAGDAAISAALSNDSAAFLASAQQRGGQ
jgi:hypothetical protein